MMAAPLPPDHDNIIPQHRHRQVAALAAMFGEPEPLPSPPAGSDESSLLAGLELRAIRVTDGPSFTPTPGSLDETRQAGRLFWLPHKLPYEQHAGWYGIAHTDGDPRTLYVQITVGALDGSRRPKTPASCAALRDELTKHRDKLGVYSLTIDRPPAEWTFETIKDLAFIMDALLQADDDHGPAKARFVVWAVGGDAGLHIHHFADGVQFTARILSSGVLRIARDWCRAFGHWFDGDSPRHTDHNLDKIDNLQPTNTATADPPNATAHDDDDPDDDDLDEIERAARRTLHGNKAVQRQEHDTLIEAHRTLLRAILKLSPYALHLVASLAHQLAEDGR